MKPSRTLIITAIILSFLIEIAMAVPIPDSVYYGRVLGDDGKPTTFSEVVARLHGATSELDPETGAEQNPIIALSEAVEDEDLGEIYVLRIPRDDGAGLEDKNRLTAMAGDKLFILVDGEVVDETSIDGIEVKAAFSDVHSMNLNGPDCPNLADCDGDGLADAWEQLIIHADANDDITSIDDVDATDDFDGDGLTNLQEFHFGTSPVTPNAPPNISGAVYQIIAFESGTCLESTTADASVSHSSCHDGLPQLWRFEAVGDEFFQVSTVDGLNCLRVPEVGIPEGTRVTQGACTADDTQLWSVERDGDLHRIVSAYNDHCLTPIIAEAEGSGDVLEAPCITAANPQWVLLPVNLEVVYEDAEDGTIAGWKVYDDDPEGASISNVFDEIRETQVIELSGDGTHNGYSFRNDDRTSWRNFSHLTLSWDMRFSEAFTVYIDVETTEGHRYLQYNPIDTSLLGDGEYIKHGIGSHLLNNQWHTVVRDLAVDLHVAQPDVDILEVNGFLIRGSGRVDNIKLKFNVSQSTMYENAEDGTTAGWRVYDDDPVGATMTNVADDLREGRVIELSGDGISNGYSLRNEDRTSWKNSHQFTLTWDMRFSHTFTVYIDVETTQGHRYLQYNPMATSRLGDGEYIKHGIGSHILDNQWHTITRDLQADLHKAQPGNDILEVNGVLIRGSGRVDNIQLQ